MATERDEAHLVVDDVIVKGAHGRLADGCTVARLSRLPVATLQVAGSRETDLNGTVDLEDVVEEVVVAVPEELKLHPRVSRARKGTYFPTIEILRTISW